MKTITDKILKIGVTYRNVKFIRCYNFGARLINCIWEYGVFDDGIFINSIFKSGIWENGRWVEFGKMINLKNRLGKVDYINEI